MTDQNPWHPVPPSQLDPAEPVLPFFVAGWIVQRPHEALLVRVDRYGNVHLDVKPITERGPAAIWSPVEVTAPNERRRV